MNIIGLVFLSIFGGENVSLRMNVPKEVSAGAEFDIEITLRKGSAESFARFQQELPRGLTAQVIDQSTANFAFEDQKVKFIWLNLPQEKEFKIAYRIKVDERLKGNFDIKGLFSYIESNQRKSVDIIADNISIRPSTRIDPNLIVDISEFQQMVPYQPPVTLLASNVRCIRQTPFYTGFDNDMMVNILVNKGSTEKFAKIEEVLPTGYTAEAIEARDAIFTFKDQTVKMLWMNLPPEQRFVVSYRLTPEKGLDKADLKLSGTFSFIVNEATQVIDIVQRDVDLSNLDPKNLDNIIASVPSP